MFTRLCTKGLYSASSLCNLCVLCVSVVVFLTNNEPQRHRAHRGCTEKSVYAYLTAYVHDRSLIRIFFRLPQHLVRYRRRIAFAECNVFQQVRNWIPFTPTKVNVRQLSGFISKKKQKRS